MLIADARLDFLIGVFGYSVDESSHSCRGDPGITSSALLALLLVIGVLAIVFEDELRSSDSDIDLSQ